MSDCADMTTALARELTHGIRNEVEDLSAVFKKMAKLKPFSDMDESAISDEAFDIADVSDVPSIMGFYAPPKQQSIQNSTGFPDDFDPFADDFEPFLQKAA